LGRSVLPLSPRPLPAIAALCLGALVACSPASDGRQLLVFEGPTMGTTYAVKVAAAEIDAAERDAIRLAIERELSDVDRQMSTYRPDSELSRFNRHASTEPFVLS
jgi:thiamine biosynthesis lipoprotein